MARECGNAYAARKQYKTRLRQSIEQLCVQGVESGWSSGNAARRRCVGDVERLGLLRVVLRTGGGDSVTQVAAARRGDGGYASQR